MSCIYCIGASVSLTVEGGVSLVGPHCPGTVRLFCEGVDLTSLRWRYNGDMNIISYFSDGLNMSTPQLLITTVQLIAVEQNQNNRNLANFSSILTVNLSQLQSQNVTEISCGDPRKSKVEPVDVSIIEPGIPNTPTITTVTVGYQSRQLSSVEITWKKSVSAILIFEYSTINFLSYTGKFLLILWIGP